MAQATNRDDAKQATDAAKAGVDRTADLAKEAVSKTTAKVTAATDAALDKGREVADQADRAAPMVRLVLDQAAPAMRDLVKAEGDLATFWVGSLANRCSSTSRRCSGSRPRAIGARRWRSRPSICGRAWRCMSDGLTRQMELAGNMTSRFLAAGENQKGGLTPSSERARAAAALANRDRGRYVAAGLDPSGRCRRRSVILAHLLGQGADPQPQRVQPDEAFGVALVVDLVLLEGGEGQAVEACSATCGRPPGGALVQLQPDRAGRRSPGSCRSAPAASRARARTRSRCRSARRSAASARP